MKLMLNLSIGFVKNLLVLIDKPCLILNMDPGRLRCPSDKPENRERKIKMSYIYLAVAIISEVIGTSALKATKGFTVLVPSAVVVIGYGLAFYFLSLALKTMDVGVAYAIWAGLGIVLVAAAGAVIYKQMPDLPAVIGMGLIVAGVAVINIFSNTASH